MRKNIFFYFLLLNKFTRACKIFFSICFLFFPYCRQIQSNNGHQVDNTPPLPSGIDWTVLDDAIVSCRPGTVRRATVVYNGPVTSLEAPENRDLAQRCQPCHHAGRLGLKFQSRRQVQTRAGQLVDVWCSALLVSSEEGAPSCTCHSHCRRVGSIPPHRAVLFFPSWMWPPSTTFMVLNSSASVNKRSPKCQQMNHSPRGFAYRTRSDFPSKFASAWQSTDVSAVTVPVC